MTDMLQAFEAEIARAEYHHRNRGGGGQQVLYTGDWAAATPSVLTQLRWWARALREERGARDLRIAESVRDQAYAAALDVAGHDYDACAKCEAAEDAGDRVKALDLAAIVRGVK